MIKGDRFVGEAAQGFGAEQFVLGAIDTHRAIEGYYGHGNPRVRAVQYRHCDARMGNQETIIRNPRVGIIEPIHGISSPLSNNSRKRLRRALTIAGSSSTLLGPESKHRYRRTRIGS